MGVGRFVGLSVAMGSVGATMGASVGAGSTGSVGATTGASVGAGTGRKPSTVGSWVVLLASCVGSQVQNIVGSDVSNSCVGR